MDIVWIEPLIRQTVENHILSDGRADWFKTRETTTIRRKSSG
jgi:hypothetical protein